MIGHGRNEGNESMVQEIVKLSGRGIQKMGLRFIKEIHFYGTIFIFYIIVTVSTYVPSLKSFFALFLSLAEVFFRYR